MSDKYVSQEAIKNALVDKFKARIGSSHVPTWNDAFDAVTNLPAADVVERPRWISVKERMPEDGKNVLAYEGGGFYFLDWCSDGKWVVASASTAVVTHWMPLPEPPKEET